MLEKIGKEGFQSISRPNRYVLESARDLISKHPLGFRYAELGVGIGATTIEISKNSQWAWRDSPFRF